MNGRDDEARRTDEAWREIVDNYGERAELVDGPALEGPDHASPGAQEPASDPGPPPSGDPVEDLWREEERFVPPPPPPVPRPGWRRGTAWAGLFLSPAIVLVLLVAQVDLPSYLDHLLVAWSVGGFVYLVATMRDEPRGPGDDGSRI